MPPWLANDEPHASPDQPGRAADLERLRRLMVVGRPPGGDAQGDPYTPLQQVLGPVGPRRLVDLLEGQPGSGGALVGLWLALHATRERGELVVIDPTGEFYPPAAVAWGGDARRLLLVRPGSQRDALVATEMALRSPAVGAVWASLDRIEGRAFRRLLLAAEGGSAFGILVRPARHEPDPCWADVQLRLDPIASPGDPYAPFLIHAARRRNRHGPAGGTALLAMDWRTGTIQEQAPLDATATYLANTLPLAAGLARTARRA